MANVWFCSDLHIAHKNIGKFRPDMGSEEGNRAFIKAWWNRLVTKRDLVWVLGDSAFSEEGIDFIASLAGEKRLLRGNHDDYPLTSYQRAFSEIYGLFKYKDMWLSHAPIHPAELRGKVNCHGHVHNQTIQLDGEDDPRYLNCCVENFVKHLGRPLASLTEVRRYFTQGTLNETKKT